MSFDEFFDLTAVRVVLKKTLQIVRVIHVEPLLLLLISH